jgi:hypothetical protein
LKNFSKAIKINSKTAEYYYARASLTLKYGSNTKNCFEDYESALRLCPNNPLFLIGIANCCEKFN